MLKPYKKKIIIIFNVEDALKMHVGCQQNLYNPIYRQIKLENTRKKQGKQSQNYITTKLN